MQIDNFALIIGTMKGGTTSLFNYLAEHPQISPCLEKEPEFFADPAKLAKGSNYYQSLWDWQPNKHKIALEASTAYTRVTHSLFLNAAENIYKYSIDNNVDFKFIYILRHPIERIESHYTHGRAWGYGETKKSLAEGIDREVLETTKYALQLEEYYQRFPAEKILLLNFSDLKQNPRAILRKICDFLCLDDEYDFEALNTVYNQGEARTTITLPGWYKIRNTNLMKSLSEIIPLEQKKRFRSIFGRKVNDYIRLSPEQRILVWHELRSDLKKLHSEYGFDISRWQIET